MYLVYSSYVSMGCSPQYKIVYQRENQLVTHMLQFLKVFELLIATSLHWSFVGVWLVPCYFFAQNLFAKDSISSLVQVIRKLCQFVLTKYVNFLWRIVISGTSMVYPRIHLTLNKTEVVALTEYVSNLTFWNLNFLKLFLNLN